MSKTRVLRFLYHFVIVGAGFSTLALEMITSRVLSPYFGTSLDVWGAILTVSLSALALGYYWGEYTLCKKEPEKLPGIFARRAFSAVIFVLFGIIAIYPVLSQTVNLPLAAGAFIGTAVLVFPCFLLTASLTPILSAVEIMTAVAQNRENPALTGRTGAVLAESTLGSVAGALVCSYLLIPTLTIGFVLIFTMIPLFVAASAVMVGHSRLMPRSARFLQIGAVLVVAAVFFSGETADARFIDFAGVRAEQEAVVRTGYGTVRIIKAKLPIDRESWRFILIDGRTQGAVRAETGTAVPAYTNATVNMIVNYPAKINNVLVLGGGAGVIARDLTSAGIKVDVVDIVKEMKTISEKFFYMQKEVSFIQQDARTFLNRCRRSGKLYDVIVFDVFGGYGVPEYLFTVESLSAAKNCLSPKGFITLNALRHPQSEDIDAIMKTTLSVVFPYVDMYAPINSELPFTNSIWAASEKSLYPMRFYGGKEPDFLKRELKEDWVYSAVKGSGPVSKDGYPVYAYKMKKNFEREHRLTIEAYGTAAMKP